MSSPLIRRGNIVLVRVPYLKGESIVRRPALIVCDPGVMPDVIIAPISSRVRTPLPSVHYLIEQSHPDWQICGLHQKSVVRCDRLFTIERSDVSREIGRLSDATMLQVGNVLRDALAL